MQNLDIAAVLADDSAAPHTDVLGARVSLAKPVSLAKRTRPNTDTLLRSGLHLAVGAGVGVGIVSYGPTTHDGRTYLGAPVPGIVWDVDGITHVTIHGGGDFRADTITYRNLYQGMRKVRTYQLRRMVAERGYGQTEGRLPLWVRKASRKALVVVLADMDVPFSERTTGGSLDRLYPMSSWHSASARARRKARAGTGPRLTGEARDFLASHFVFGHIGGRA